MSYLQSIVVFIVEITKVYDGKSPKFDDNMCKRTVTTLITILPSPCIARVLTSFVNHYKVYIHSKY